jgi:hypothetical protein
MCDSCKEVPEEEDDANTETNLLIAQTSNGKFLDRLKQHFLTYSLLCVVSPLY